VGDGADTKTLVSKNQTETERCCNSNLHQLFGTDLSNDEAVWRNPQASQPVVRHRRNEIAFRTDFVVCRRVRAITQQKVLQISGHTVPLKSQIRTMPAAGQKLIDMRASVTLRAPRQGAAFALVSYRNTKSGRCDAA
jgi:hypothetical protein